MPVFDCSQKRILSRRNWYLKKRKAKNPVDEKHGHWIPGKRGDGGRLWRRSLKDSLIYAQGGGGSRPGKTKGGGKENIKRER